MKGERAWVCSAIFILGLTASAVSFILRGAKYQLDLSIYYHQKRRSLVPLQSRLRPRVMMPVSSFLPSNGPPPEIELDTDDDTSKTPNDDDDTTQQPRITITLMVAMSSAILACLVLLCILAMRSCSNKNDPSIFSQTIETQKLTLAMPKFPRVMPTDDSILDITLYGETPDESISPMSSAAAEDDSSSVVPVEQILRQIHDFPKNNLVCANTESCSDSSHRPESRDDEDERDSDDFVYDIILASNAAIEDFGLVLQDPFCAVTHPVVIRVDPDSPFAGRLGPGDFLLAMDDVSLMGQSVVHWQTERRPTKFTVMTSRQEGRELCNRTDETGSPIITVEV